jgi:glycosyltransferase involved in cell wall biosynthesis
LIAPDAGVERELIQAGYAAQRICRIANGVATGSRSSGSSRFDARLALATVNEDLTVALDAPIAVYMGRLRKENGLVHLVKAWQPISCRWPEARLWLIGDGPFRDELYRRIVDLELHRCIFMPGTFDEVDEVLTAANLLVQPSGEPGVPQAMLEAVVAGVPVVATDTLDVRRYARELGICTELVPLGDAAALSEAMIRLLERPPSGRTLAASRSRMAREHSVSRMVKQHLELFERVIQRKGW